MKIRLGEELDKISVPIFTSSTKKYCFKKVFILMTAAIFVGGFLFSILNFSSQVLANHEPEPECTPEETQPCDTGELGICAAGTQICDEAGFWEECVRNEEPTDEICDNCLDDNCDGDTDCDDEGCFQDPVCLEPPEEPMIISAYKVVCETEEDLPNWATSGTQPGEPSVIEENTAQDYVDASDGKCWLEENWDFQWGFDGEAQKQDGNYIGPAPNGTGWHDFDSTSTPAEVQISELNCTTKIWVRENLKEDYIPFPNPPGDTQDDVSAEMLCHTDILNYDNYDYIINPQLDETYYCVAFNALEETEPYCGDGIINGEEECEYDQDCSEGEFCNNCICEEIPVEPECGNGILENGEGCDDGAQNGQACIPTCNSSCSYCSSECTLLTLHGGGCGGYLPYCGNRILDSGEECDDGNTQNDDGCSSTCALEKVGCNMDLDVMMIMDVSGSMGYEVPTRLSRAKIAANNFLGNLRSEDQSGLVSFSWTATLDKSLSNQHALTQSTSNGLTAGGATNISDAIDKANLELISANANPEALKVQILLTDGRANRPNGDGSTENPNDVALTIAKSLEATNNGIIIFTIGLGDSINTEMLQTVATNTGGKYYSAPTASDLDRIFNQIAYETCNYETEFELPALTIYNQRIESSSEDSVTVSWYTNILSTSRVVYGEQSILSPGSSPNYGYAYSTPETDTIDKVIFHLVTIDNLIPNATYYWRGISHASPDEVLGQESTFSTVIVETPETPEGEIPPVVETPGEGITSPETPKEEFIPEGEPGEAAGLFSRFAAAIGSFFGSRNFCWLFFIIIIVLVVLCLLERSKQKEKKTRWILPLVILILIILYYFICPSNFWILIIVTIVLIILSLVLREKKKDVSDISNE